MTSSDGPAAAARLQKPRQYRDGFVLNQVTVDTTVLIRLVAAILLPASLEAASIASNTVTFDMTGSNLISSFTPFNPALGTLTQVSYTRTMLL